MRLQYKVLALVVLIAALGYLFYPFILPGAARFLIVQDQLKKSDAIVVLSGDGNGERISQAAELFRQGYARYFLISGGQLYWNITYAEVMSLHAQALGIPKPAILIEDRSVSTYENAVFSLPILKSRGVHSIILVTSPTHSRRAKRTFESVFDKSGISVSIYPAQKSRFILKNWWLRHEDTQEVILEHVKLLGYILKGW